VEVAEEGGYMGEFWYDERLDQDLCCFICDEGPDPVDVVESNSTRSGHRGNVGIAAQLVVQYHAKIPCSRCRGDFDVLNGDKSRSI